MSEADIRTPESVPIGQLMMVIRGGNVGFARTIISGDPNNLDFVGWAKIDITSSSPIRRYLAATLFEHADGTSLIEPGDSEMSPLILHDLREAMTDRADDNDFLAARLAAASALCKHEGPSDETIEVIRGIASQTNIPALAATAQARLAQIEQMERTQRE